jgi:type VI protein secretion system component VasF
MINQDYTKEISVASPQRIVPWRHAALILAVLAVVAWFGVRALMSHTTLDHSTQESVPPAATPAPAPKP